MFFPGRTTIDSVNRRVPIVLSRSFGSGRPGSGTTSGYGGGVAEGKKYTEQNIKKKKLKKYIHLFLCFINVFRFSLDVLYTCRTRGGGGRHDPAK